MKSKSILSSLLIAMCVLNIQAQSYMGMTYQAVVRNSSNALVANKEVGFKISIIDNIEKESVVYSETHTLKTNLNGLATFIIGQGTKLSGEYGSIDWSRGNYYLKTDTDPTGGTNYTISNTTQFMSVPYALYSEKSGDGWKRAGNAVDLKTDFIGSTNDVDVVFKRNNLQAGKIGFENTYLGVGAGEFNTMSGNVAIGTNALRKGGGGGSVGNLNTAVGHDAYPNNVQGYGNAAFGHSSLYNNTHGFYNTAVGNSSLQNLTTGDYNAGIGSNSLTGLTTGDYNIGIGVSSAVPSPTANNQLSIGNVIYGTNMGNTATGTIGIGVPVPTERLEVAGKTKTTNLQVTAGAGANKVLTSDAAGNATWQNSNANTGINIRKNSTQTIIPETLTKINFENEFTDDANAFNTSTSGWTIPSAGFYHINGSVQFRNGQSGALVSMIICINGLIAKEQVHNVQPMTHDYNISADLKLNANDIITICIRLDNTSYNQTVYGGNLSSTFSGYKVY